ncbi:autotransporter outer membrane beta-barrel domain-containing protein [Citrobacter amalonaticus]|nr:autotransporter outer membrane beta-barrel domain-containing protein [Citrobacter amalonaticus]
MSGVIIWVKKSATQTRNGAAYKLYQNGFELGGDKTTTFDSGYLVTGTFFILSDNRVHHARGGKSKLNSYGLGTYATWYDNRGFYVDGVARVNRLNSQLQARMSNGESTSGRWHQYGISSALETGYTVKLSESFYVEPFARMTGTQINDASVKLSNGMQAKTGKARSLTAEAGGAYRSII